VEQVLEIEAALVFLQVLEVASTVVGPLEASAVAELWPVMEVGVGLLHPGMLEEQAELGVDSVEPLGFYESSLIEDQLSPQTLMLLCLLSVAW